MTPPPLNLVIKGSGPVRHAEPGGLVYAALQGDGQRTQHRLHVRARERGPRLRDGGQPGQPLLHLAF